MDRKANMQRYLDEISKCIYKDILSTITKWPPASWRNGLCLRPGQQGVRNHVRRGTWTGWWTQGPVVLKLWPGQEQHQHLVGSRFRCKCKFQTQSQKLRVRDPGLTIPRGFYAPFSLGTIAIACDLSEPPDSYTLLFVVSREPPQIIEECLYMSRLDLTLIFPRLLLCGSYVIFLLQLRYSEYVNCFSF